MARRPLTEKQEAFLNYLFGEAAGCAAKAKRMAGYSDNTNTHNVVMDVEDEIIERTKLYLVQNGPKAASAITNLIDNPVQMGGKIKLDAAKDVLDRVGVARTEKVEVVNGVFILPPKDGD